MPRKRSAVVKTKKAFKPAQPKLKAVKDDGAEKPTPEMRARVHYEFGPVKTEMNIQIGSAYRRQPLYVTMSKTAGRFSLDEMAALNDYRSIFDRCERSPMASCLASLGGSGGGGVGPSAFMSGSPAIAEAKRKLSLLERGLGHYLATMRAVVLRDQSFSAIAMERYGCRTRSWIVVNDPVMRNGQPVMKDGKPVMRDAHREDVVPRSGRDRERVALEFRQGLKLLTVAAQRLGGAGIDEVWIHPREDGTAIIHRASCAPNGFFRLWGSPRFVDGVIDDLLARNNDTLVFASPTEARALLDAVDDGRLFRLEPDELAV
jgi:hypothetical protein